MIKCSETSRLRQSRTPESYKSANKYCACVEFHLENDDRHGFHTSQLIDYILTTNPGAGDDKDAPPEKLALAFSTTDIVLLGWRLGRLADLLRENELAIVSNCPNATPKWKS